MRHVLFFLLLLSVSVMSFGQRGRISDADFDEEDLMNEKRWSSFHFTKSETIMIGVGVLLMVIGIQLNAKPGNESCLCIALAGIGLICVWPLISAILSFLTLLLRIVVIGALIVAAGAYVNSYFKKQNDS
jgi:hypothetical protein